MSGILKAFWFIPVVLKNFYIFPHYKLKHCQFLPNKNHKKDNWKNFTLLTVKKRLPVKGEAP